MGRAMKRRRQPYRWALAVCLAALAVGCTRFYVEQVRTDGTVAWRVSETGAPFLSRVASIDITHSWLDEETNTLHEAHIKRNLDENANTQVQALQLALEAVRAAYAPQAGAPAATP